MSAFKVLLIGGSNFVISNGIRKHLEDILRKSINQTLEIRNIAVGGTGSLLGLERLSEESLEDTPFDTILIEYGINDWGTYQTNPLLWQAGFEALFQKLQFNWPRADIINVILGRRDQRFWNNQAKMHEIMTSIANEYNATTINIDKDLKSLSGKQPFDQFYRDDAHIAEPIITHHVASLISNHILRKKDNANFNITKTQKKQKTLKTHALERKDIFQNSQFTAKCRKLIFGETINLKLATIPHAVSFVSTKDSGALHIKIKEKAIIINTTQGESNYKLDFVIKHTPINGMFSEKFPDNQKLIDIEITAIDSTHSLWDNTIIQKVWATTVPLKTKPEAYIINLSTIECHE